MKSFFKRSVISMIVLGMAGSSYAAMSHDTNNHHNHNHNGTGMGGSYVNGYGGGYGNGCCNYGYLNTMWMPHFSGFFVGVEGLDLRPQNGDLDFATTGVVTTGLLNTPFITHRISTSYDWDWRFYAGLTFDCDDLTFSWLHIDTSDHSDLITTGDAPIATRFLFTDTFTGAIRARAKFDVDEAYLVWGHTIKFNNPWSIRFAAGVEYAKVDSDLTIDALSTEVEDEFFVGNEVKSHLRGWGPRVELDATYHFPCSGLGWFARTNAALLSSRRRVTLNAIDNDIDTGPEVFPATWSSRHIVIPKIGIKLGVSYSWMWGQMGGEGCCGAPTFFTVEAGWQADAYIHAIERPVSGFVTGGLTPGVTLQPTAFFADTKTSNFTDQGWFIGLKVGMGWL